MVTASHRGTKGYIAFGSATLGVSLGNRNSEGARIKAVATWLSGRFSHVIIDLSDTLNRYNVMADFGLSEVEAELKCRKEGDEWIKNNVPIFQKLGINFSVIRWDERLNDPNFKAEFERMKQAYTENAELRLAVNNDISAFLKRRGKTLDSISAEQHRLYTLYLLEEVTAHSLHFEKMPSARVYPGKEQETYRIIGSSKVANVHDGLKNSYYTRIWIVDDQEKPTWHKQAVNDFAKPKTPAVI